MYEKELKNLKSFINSLKEDLEVVGYIDNYDEQKILELVINILNVMTDSRVGNNSLATARDLAIATNYIARVNEHLQKQIANEFESLQLENTYNE